MTEAALSSPNLFDAMTRLADGLQKMLGCEIVGVLALESEGGRLLLRMSAPQRISTVGDVQKEIIRRCESIRGKAVPKDSLHVVVDGPGQDEGDSQLLQFRSVPVIADNEVTGMISLAFMRPVKIPPNAVTFLYHAANHFATVMQAGEKIRTLAIHDPLTGAYNRLYLEQELERIWLLATRYDHVMGLMLIDVDYFKLINDAKGHAVGDAVLAEFARELQAMTRASDLLVRMGGDEFLLVLPKTRLEEAEELARRIVTHIRHHEFLVDSHKVRVTTTTPDPKLRKSPHFTACSRSRGWPSCTPPLRRRRKSS
jgi:diguanylate cyclase (GGDEF)-like protein